MSRDSAPHLQELPPIDLATLLATEDPGEFLDQCWTERPYLAHGPLERLEAFFFDDIADLLALRSHHVKAFYRTVDGEPSNLVPPPHLIVPLYHAGFTIYFQSIRSPRTDALASAISQELGLVREATRIAAFASRRGLGLAAHYDHNDNLVIQIKGTKRWHIAPNRHVRWPTKPHTVGHPPGPIQKSEAPDGFPASIDEIEGWQTVETHPGSVMYLPRGCWHYVETVEAESLHFNIQTGLANWKDLAVHFLLTKLPIGRQELREGIWNLFEGGVLRPEYQQALKGQIEDLVASLKDGDYALTQDEFSTFLARNRLS